MFTITTAVKLVKDPSVEVDGPFGVKESLVKQVEIHRQEKHQKKTGSSIPPKSSPEKPVALKARTGMSVVYTFSIHQGYEGKIDQLLGNVFDVMDGSLEEMETFLGVKEVL